MRARVPRVVRNPCAAAMAHGLRTTCGRRPSQAGCSRPSGDGEVAGSGWGPPVPERTDEPAPVAEPADEEKTTEFEPPANADDERRE